jgi:serine O-acetyltransferase
MPVLYFKGFHAIQTHRFAHWLYENRAARTFALYLQSRSSSRCSRRTSTLPPASARAFSSTTPPAFVVGETAVIEDNVSILQGVTLGGTGKEGGDRHPKIRHGVLIGAGAKDPRQYRIGHCSRRSRPARSCLRPFRQQDGRGRSGQGRRRNGLRSALARQMDHMLPSQIVDNIATYDI